MNLSPLPIQKFFDNDGRPLVGGQLFTYSAGTSIKIATYSNASGAVNTNPIILDFRGECRVWLDPALAYKFILSPAVDTDPPTAPIWTVDQITAAPPSADNAAQDTGTANNITLSIPSVTSLSTFLRVVFKALSRNTGPTLLTINGLPAKEITLQNLSSLSGGEIQSAGMYEAIYDGVQWQLQGPTLQPTQMLSARESSASAIPGIFWFSRTPVYDPRRYGTSLNKWDGTTDDTVPMQHAWNVAFSDKGRIKLPNDFIASCGALSLTFDTNRFTGGFSIEGSGPSSVIRQRGTPVSVMNFIGATPTGDPRDINLVLENFTVDQETQAKTAHGITLNGVGGCRLSGMMVQGFNRNLNLSSALIVLADQMSSFTDCNTAIYVRRNGAGSTTNQITVRDCRLNYSTLWAIDYSGGSEINMYDNQIEANGTTGNANTGGVIIRGALAPDVLIATVNMLGNRFEANFGTQFMVEAPTGGARLSVRVIAGQFFASESNRCIKILGARSVRIEDLQCGPNETWDITAEALHLDNTGVDVLTDTGVTRPYYNDSRTSTVDNLTGRSSSYTGTLTGCTTAPTAAVFTNEYGTKVDIRLTSNVATSNTTSCHITGMPPRLWPSAPVPITCISQNNGVESVMQGTVQTNGDIYLRADGTFTAAGNKGASACQFSFFK